MTIEYTPVGISCNLSCTYCYQDSMREAGNISSPRNWERAKKALEDYNYEFVVFGGEPLLAPIEHLEEVWKFGFEKFKRNGIQTNGSLITEDHINLFRKYNVGVGISIDGPGDLNDARVCTSKDTLDTTNHTIWAIKRLCELRHFPSLIVTLHARNASRGKIGRLLEWFSELETLGIRHINLHDLEVEKGMPDIVLSEQDNIQAFLDIYEWSKTSKMRVEPFCDIYAMLTQENPDVSCVWNHCDPATTSAVQGVESDGSRSNCGRVNKDGINWVKADSPGYERYLILRQTPHEFGGCKDCRYFFFCRGQCPGTAIDGDWRNRTRDCLLWLTLFRTIEEEILRWRLPNTYIPEMMEKIEKRNMGIWTNHGDAWHGDSPHGDAHGDAPHGDSPHGDAYEDSILGIQLDQPPEFFTA